MKTILINKTLTTIALISTIQCGYGTGMDADHPIVLSSLEAIKSNSNYDDTGTDDPRDDVYTLKAPENGTKYYKIEPSDDDIILTTNLVIPKNAQVTHNWGYSFYIGDYGNDKYIPGSLTNNGTFENTGDMIVHDGSTLTLSGGTFTNSNSMNVYGSMTLSGGTFTNNNMNVTGSMTLSGGTFTNSNQMNVRGSMEISGNGAFIMGSESELSVQTLGKFYVSDNNTHDVTLNGTILIESTDATVDVSKMNFFPGKVQETVGEQTITVDKDSHGTIDMSPLRPYPSDETAIQALKPWVFTCKQSQQLPNIILPFNCQFSNVDLSNAASVSYTVLLFVNSAKIDNYIIKVGDIPSQVSQDDIAVSYGDYANNSSLGVTLPNDANKDNKNVATLYLSYLVNKKDENDELKYNKSDYQLDTDDLDDAPDTIEAGESHTYNFGFIGTTPIEITGSGTAKFMGDNSGYTPKDEDDSPVEITLPDNVEFGNKSLFQFTQTYKHGVFTAGNYTNTIPAGKIVTFTGGFSLGAGHTLIVQGILIG